MWVQYSVCEWIKVIWKEQRIKGIWEATWRWHVAPMRDDFAKSSCGGFGSIWFPSLVPWGPIELCTLSFQYLSDRSLRLVFGKLRSCLLHFYLGHGGLPFRGFAISHCETTLQVLLCPGDCPWALNCGSVLTGQVAICFCLGSRDLTAWTNFYVGVSWHQAMHIWTQIHSGMSLGVWLLIGIPPTSSRPVKWQAALRVSQG